VRKAEQATVEILVVQEVQIVVAVVVAEVLLLVIMAAQVVLA
jgi:hypothetical protein